MAKRCCAKSCFNSQTNNKSVHYFGFPKHEEFANKWLELAQREDLMGKPIQQIIKYHLCSDHFTDDCFAAPPDRSKLNKCLRPFSVPLPSRFTCNIDQYIRTDTVVATYRIPNYPATPHHDVIDVVRDGIHLTNSPTDVFIEEDDIPQYEQTPHDDPSLIAELGEIDGFSEEVPDNIMMHDEISPDAPHPDMCFDSDYGNGNAFDEQDTAEHPVAFVSDDDIENVDSIREGIEEYEEYPSAAIDDTMLIIVEETETEMETRAVDEKQCRLCAQVFAITDSLLCIYGADNSLSEDLQLLMGDMITHNDGLPQQICFLCYTKLTGCVKVLEGFRKAQDLLL